MKLKGYCADTPCFSSHCTSGFHFFSIQTYFSKLGIRAFLKQRELVWHCPEAISMMMEIYTCAVQFGSQ